MINVAEDKMKSGSLLRTLGAGGSLEGLWCCSRERGSGRGLVCQTVEYFFEHNIAFEEGEGMQEVSR